MSDWGPSHQYRRPPRDRRWATVVVLHLDRLPRGHEQRPRPTGGHDVIRWRGRWRRAQNPSRAPLRGRLRRGLRPALDRTRPRRNPQSRFGQRPNPMIKGTDTARAQAWPSPHDPTLAAPGSQSLSRPRQARGPTWAPHSEWPDPVSGDQISAVKQPTPNYLRPFNRQEVDTGRLRRRSGRPAPGFWQNWARSFVWLVPSLPAQF